MSAVEWTPEMRATLSHLFHLARTALAGTGRRVTRYDQRVWAARKFAEMWAARDRPGDPPISSTAAYKRLCRDDAWRG